MSLKEKFLSVGPAGVLISVMIFGTPVALWMGQIRGTEWEQKVEVVGMQVDLLPGEKYVGLVFSPGMDRRIISRRARAGEGIERYVVRRMPNAGAMADELYIQEH